MVMLHSLDKAIVRIRNQGSVDFDVFDQVEHALLHTLEKLAKSGLLTPSSCECHHISSLQERFFQLSISTDQVIDQNAQTVVKSSRNSPCGLRQSDGSFFDTGLAVLLVASGLASNLCNHSCQLFETLGIRQTFHTSQHCWRGALDC